MLAAAIAVAIAHIGPQVSEIIYNASKGSKFFNNESTRDKNLTGKIERILSLKSQLDRIDLSHDLRKADEYIAQLEASRDLSQVIVHLDCDAFYAACEELDRPELRDVPFAVGKGVLTTCNYHARRFGCRSGMAGFVALKLCPQLICLPLNFAKYTAKATEVRAILTEYDERFESASIDEAYLNLTEYCAKHGLSPEDAVNQLRAEIHSKTHITVSAGIAANTKLAKIGSNRNKPNGQFRVPNDRASIMAFMADLPTRKVNGVGRVFERELAAVGINTCGDIYNLRGQITRLFGEKAFQFLMHCYLGLGRTSVQPADEYERKSVGTERTFRELTGRQGLREQLRKTAKELEEDCARTQVRGRTLVLKIKLHTFEVLTRQTQPPFAVSKADDLYRFAEPMLARLEKDIPRMTLRLMGLRVTHLISTEKKDVDFFGAAARRTPTTATGAAEKQQQPNVDADGWEIWPDVAFEEAARQEQEDHMEEMEALSQEHERELAAGATPAGDNSGTGGAGTSAFHPSLAEALDDTPLDTTPPPPETWDCPVCSRPQPADERSFNDHVDFCLSRQTIKQVVRDTSAPPAAAPPAEKGPAAKVGQNKKRGRSGKETPVPQQKQAKRKLFFG